MNTNDKLEKAVLELTAVRDNLTLLSFQFENKDESSRFSNEILSNVLSGIAYHIDHIENDLVSLAKTF